MKYIIEYKVGNGYSCNCCGRWSHDSQEFDSLHDALNAAVEYNAAHSSDFIYESARAIPESPDDFELIYGEYVPKFDSYAFDQQVEKLTEAKKQEIIENEKKEKLLEKQKQEQLKEEQDRAEYERLKKKYEK